MGDYPLGVDGKGKPGGVVRFLEDTDGDGRYDKATIFLDGLGFPTGVMPWRKGVLVACAPDIFYAEDRDGDGKADQREVLFTGFAEGNQQHRVNGFELGPRRLGLRRQRRQRRHGPLAQDGQDVDIQRPRLPVPARHRRVRGRERPDAVRPAPRRLGQLVRQQQPDLGLALRPRRAGPAPQPALRPARPAADARARHPALSRQPDARPVQRPRRGQPRHLGQQPDALPRRPVRPAVRHAACSSASRCTTWSTGWCSSPTARRFRGRRGRRTRPTASSSPRATTGSGRRMLKTGPDGALWVADMYRAVIEHPEWIPDDWEKRSSTSAPGSDQGRIYRVYPGRQDAPADPPARPARHRRAWSPRSTARAAGSATRPSGCLLHRGDPRRDRAAPRLARDSTNGPRRGSRRSGRSPTWAASTRRPVTGGPDRPASPGPAQRDRGRSSLLAEHVARAGRGRAAAGRRSRRRRSGSRSRWSWATGTTPAPARPWRRLARRDADDPWIRAAVLSSAVPHVATLLADSVRRAARRAAARGAGRAAVRPGRARCQDRRADRAGRPLDRRAGGAGRALRPLAVLGAGRPARRPRPGRRRRSTLDLRPAVRRALATPPAAWSADDSAAEADRLAAVAAAGPRPRHESATIATCSPGCSGPRSRSGSSRRPSPRSARTADPKVADLLLARLEGPLAPGPRARSSTRC